jgi:hypothetical protein
VADPSPLLHDTICDLRKQLADKDAVIDDLRRRLDAAEARLDAEAKERRKLTIDPSRRARDQYDWSSEWLSWGVLLREPLRPD